MAVFGFNLLDDALRDVLNRTTRHWDTSSCTTIRPVILSAAKNLGVETLRCAQGDAGSVRIFWWSDLDPKLKEEQSLFFKIEKTGHASEE
jgi:hypothetical protein